MPLIRIPAAQAVENRKNNPNGEWGDRGSPNRVEPIALPSFKVPFTLQPGEAIFTVGSCFARNVETELARRGFEMPARGVFSQPEFANREVGIINNYGTPSIYNEFAWAFGAQEFEPDHHIIEVMPGKFADQHVSPSLRPEPRDVVLSRRAAITASYASALKCRVVIMTLGLAEVWFDKVSGYHLNVSPRPSTLKAFPDRYELHVLSYEEIYKFLADTLVLLKERGREDLQVILTVSPVPLQVTQRPEDVMVANCYSKSALRTAAEAVVARFPFVCYYPSYESVTMSDRKKAWLDDLIHVSDAIVRINVGRMVDAFVGSAPDDDRESIAAGGEAVAIVKAQSARARGGNSAAGFFSEHGVWSESSVAFAVEHARFLLDSGNAAAALDVTCLHQESGDIAIIALECEALLALDRVSEALKKVELLGGKRVKAVGLWDAIYRAALSTGNPEIVVSILSSITTHVPVRKSQAYLLGARFFRDRGDPETAIRYFLISMDRGPTNLALLELADLYVLQRRPQEARDLLKGLEPANAGEETRLRRLTELLGAVNDVPPPSKGKTKKRGRATEVAGA